MAWTVEDVGIPSRVRISVAHYSETALNDSNKRLDLSADTTSGFIAFRITTILIIYDATSVSGTRNLTLILRDNGGTAMYQYPFPSAYDIVADDSVTIACASGNVPEVSSGADQSIILPDNLWLRRDGLIDILDGNAIDAAADDMRIYITGLRYWA